MIDLYMAGTSNGLRASVALEECSLPYTLHKVDLMKGAHRKPEYLADEITIADLILYPNYASRKALLDKIGGLEHLHRWGTAMAARPGIQKGMTVLDN